MDLLVHEEPDPEFRCYLTRTRNWSHILIHAYSSDTEDIHLIDPQGGSPRAVPLTPRRRGHEFDLEWAGDRFIIRTNWNAPNFRICEAFPGESDPATWREIVPAQSHILIERLAVFRRHWVLIEFAHAVQRIRILDWNRAGEEHVVAFPDPIGHVWLDSNPNPDTAVIRLGFTSFLTPVTYYNYDLDRRHLTPLCAETVPDYDPADFAVERIHAPAPDGAAIPLTLVFRREVRARGPAPLLLFAYGAYGTNMPLFFDQARLPLLNRGFIFAMAHVRGGSECGTAWHHTGRRWAKPNSVTDLIAAAEHLVDTGYARRDALCAETLSAGGLMLGAALNRRPDLFAAVIAREPFVDPLTTMADPNLPLVCNEYGEWGDPRRREDWDNLRALSPYDNITDQPYPALLATAAFHDSQVPYWEPAKWIARLRAHQTGPHPLLLVTQMDAGHGGLSGRLARLREQAFSAAFLLSTINPGPDR